MVFLHGFITFSPFYIYTLILSDGFMVLSYGHNFFHYFMDPCDKQNIGMPVINIYCLLVPTLFVLNVLRSSEARLTLKGQS